MCSRPYEREPALGVCAPTDDGSKEPKAEIFTKEDPLAEQRAKGGKKNRKHGRRAAWCRAYEARHQRERNRLVRLAKHLAAYPNDSIARAAVVRWQAVVRPRVAA